MGEIFYGGDGSVVGRCLWHGKFCWEEIDGVGGSFISGMGNVDCVVSIVRRGRANIPAMGAVVGPCADALFFFLIYYCFHSAWCEWSCIEVEVSENLIVGGEFWIDTGSSQHVESNDGLVDETAPQVWWEVGVTAVHDGDEVVLECLDCTLRVVVSVIVWRR